jgi:Rrf2 family protein
MRLSTKGRYALEALVVLGLKNENNKNVSLISICIETSISQRYLDQLFRDLRNHNIVISKKGKNGGYQLAKPINEITVGEIFRAVEGSLSPVRCIDNEYCDRADICITRDLWVEIHDEINSVIDSITLKTLVNNYKEKLAGQI